MFNEIVYQLSAVSSEKGWDNSADTEILNNIHELDDFIDLAYDSWKEYSRLNGIPELTFKVLSGYRSQVLNEYLNGSQTSPHLKGYAVDISIDSDKYWMDYCKWSSKFANDCFKNNIPFNEVIAEFAGKQKWIHFSIKDYFGNQNMSCLLFKKDDDTKMRVVNLAETVKESIEEKVELTKDPMILKNKLKIYNSISEIEGYKGTNKMNLDVMPGAYMRCIYIMKRLMKSFSFSVEQSSGILGVLLKLTNGKLNPSHTENGKSGICLWNKDDQIRFMKFFLDENSISKTNLMNQTSFLIKDITRLGLEKKILKVSSINDACFVFYRNYWKREEKVDLSELNYKKEMSECRGFANSALEIYNNYIRKYKDEWLVGYYPNGFLKNDNSFIEKSDDKKLWSNNINGPVDKEKVNQMIENILKVLS